MTEEFYTNIELINKRMPDDISQEIKDFTVERINEFLHHYSFRYCNLSVKKIYK